jgi:hypothetical protein
MMIPSTFLRRGLLLLSSCCLVAAPMLHAQPAPSPVVLDKEYSADMTFKGAGGNVMEQKIFASNGNVRTDQVANAITILVLPDQKKMYSIMHAQRLVINLPYDPAKMKTRIAMASLQGAYEKIGPDTLNGVVCTKYKYTSEDGKVFNLWIDTVRKIPVQMEALDHSFVMQIKNYQAAPQPASLFQIPEGYQVMNRPGMPNITPPGAPAPGQ